MEDGTEEGAEEGAEAGAKDWRAEPTLWIARMGLVRGILTRRRQLF